MFSEKRAEKGLSARQKTGIRACMVGLLAVLVLFTIITITGSPIHLIGTKGVTLIYQMVVYVPVFTIVALVIKRLK